MGIQNMTTSEKTAGETAIDLGTDRASVDALIDFAIECAMEFKDAAPQDRIQTARRTLARNVF